MSCLLTQVLITLLLITTITLLATKQHVASLVTSLVTIMVMIVTLIPPEIPTQDGTWVYSSGGAPRFVEKSQTKKKVVKPTRKPAMKSPAMKSPAMNMEEEACVPELTPLPQTIRADVSEIASSSLPSCNAPPQPPTDKEMRDHIRNNGLYGIHGNLSCRKMQRTSVADKGVLQPLNARNQLLQFLAVDQMHAKDSYLIPREKIKIA
jgi:hypothetical protein